MNIYFSGIGGVGIGPLAEIAHDAGYNVVGSDAHDSPITHQLRQRGIDVAIDQDGSYLQVCHDNQPIDWFVYTAALPEAHPELVLARRLGIKTSKRDELLAHIISEKNLKLIAVAGTHGKTTATGMLVWLAKQFDIPVSYSVGATLSFGPSGKFDPESQYFIYECDEFDRNFLHFSPTFSLITSYGYDHPDTYPTPDEYRAAFRQFLEQSDQAALYHSAFRQLFEPSENDASQRYDVLLDNDVTLDAVTLAGEHNRRNALLTSYAFTHVLKSLRYDDPDLLAAINSFPGTNRRFEKLGDNLYSDYGHHPVEIAATLQLAREVSDHIVLVYQPHQNVRQHEIRDQYVDQFERADTIYWLPTYLSREDPALPILPPAVLIKNITNRDDIILANLDESLAQAIKKARDDGKLVLGMGAGSIDSWLRRI